MLIKLSFWSVAFFLFTYITFGQVSPERGNSNFADLKRTTKIDEFGDIAEKDFAPKLKSYIELLKANKSYSGYVIFYNDLNSSPFERRAFLQTQNFIYTRNICRVHT
jgi:hypothetical protein